MSKKNQRLAQIIKELSRLGFKEDAKQLLKMAQEAMPPQPPSQVPPGGVPVPGVLPDGTPYCNPRNFISCLEFATSCFMRPGRQRDACLDCCATKFAKGTREFNTCVTACSRIK